MLEKQNPSMSQSVIPHYLLAVLREARTDLERQGSVLMRRGGNYRLRYKAEDPEAGYIRHRSVDLGTDPGLARAVEGLIMSWRADADAARAERLKQEALEAKMSRVDIRRVRLERATAALLPGGGRDQQRQAVRDLLAASEAGPIAAFKLAMELPLRTAPRAGHPRRGRLW